MNWSFTYFNPMPAEEAQAKLQGAGSRFDIHINELAKA
jgi:hypothetical protein